MWLFQSLALWVWVGSGKALTLPLSFPPESRFPGKNMERMDLEPLGALGLSGYSSLRSAELGGAVASQGSAFHLFMFELQGFMYSTLNFLFFTQDELKVF